MARKYPPKVEAREKLAKRLALKRPWEEEPKKLYDVGGPDERRRDIVVDLEEAAREMRRRWRKKSVGQLGEQFEFDKAEFDKAVERAIRAGLDDHPVVRDWIASARSVGDWAKLRAFRRRFETGIRQELKKDTFWILFEAADYLEENSVESTRRHLVRKLNGYLEGHETPPEYFDLTREDLVGLRKRLTKISVPGLSQLLRRHGLSVRGRG